MEEIILTINKYYNSIFYFHLLGVPEILLQCSKNTILKLTLYKVNELKYPEMVEYYHQT